MIFETSKLVAAFKKVATVKRHDLLQCADPSRIPVDILHLIAAVGDITGMMIEVNEVDFSGDFVRGLLERYHDDSAKIYVRREQLEEYKNLTVAKELCHLLVDDGEDFSPDGHSTIESMVELHKEAEGNDELHVSHKPLASEFIAEYSAYEILYPFEYRDEDIKRINEEGETPKALALKYNIPEYVVGRCLFPPYHETIKEIWAQVNAPA